MVFSQCLTGSPPACPMTMKSPSSTTGVEEEEEALPHLSLAEAAEARMRRRHREEEEEEAFFVIWAGSSSWKRTSGFHSRRLCSLKKKEIRMKLLRQTVIFTPHLRMVSRS